MKDKIDKISEKFTKNLNWTLFGVVIYVLAIIVAAYFSLSQSWQPTSIIIVLFLIGLVYYFMIMFSKSSDCFIELLMEITRKEIEDIEKQATMEVCPKDWIFSRPKNRIYYFCECDFAQKMNELYDTLVIMEQLEIDDENLKTIRLIRTKLSELDDEIGEISENNWNEE